MKIRPKVFLEAAGMIASGSKECCCPALRRSGASLEDMAFFEDLFKWDSEGYKRRSAFWWRMDERYCREARIIALLLAHEITKEGGL